MVLAVSLLRVFNRVKNSKTNEKAAIELNFLKMLESCKGVERVFKYLPHSKSQNFQDIFVLTHLGFNKNGYFLEFGACGGDYLSNTHLLEKQFDWGGILLEPTKSWHHELSSKRNVHIEFDCVWHSSNEQVLIDQFGRIQKD